MVDGAPSSDPENEPTQREDLPDRLRVHSLARTLGTSSRRVLDALSALDGRIRSAHSSVDRVDAVRVRDLLAEQPAEEGQAEEGQQAPDAVAAEVPDAPGEPAEPESRLMLETQETVQVVETWVERPHYMPLFVAPQPISEPVAGDDADDESGDEGDDDEEQADRPANRRRRRGRRGRGRGRGEQGANDGQDQPGDDGDDSPQKTGGNSTSSDDSEAQDGADSEESDNGDDDNGSADGASRRRRRRRRRKSGAGDDGDEGPAPDDPPNTVVHERAPRSGGKSGNSDSGDDSGGNEVKGIDGSTRLEAKRQRRRDGRDAGRRRPPVLSEAEFLARREAVERVMVVRDRVRTEPPHPGSRYTQIAVLEDGIVVEHFVTSAASASPVGNIYLGIVQNVLPSMEAAFVYIGRGRNGVLYAGEVNWDAAGLGGADRKIEQALKPGDYIVVQVSKDPVGHKGARLTTQVSLAGRYLVYVPGASSTGISRKLPDTERQRLKEILREVVPSDAGVIIRTASEGVKEDDIRADVTRLQERWNQIEAKAVEIKQKAAGAAVALYEEPDVLVKVIRDLFNEDFAGLVVSGDDAWDTINEYVSSVAPDLVSKLSKYEPAVGSEGQVGPDVFAVHRIDEQLAKAMDRKVWLPSGGTLVIDRTEAMTVVDVNTGKFTGSGGNLEQTVTKNNLEAAEEIVRQLRLRDIGGIVVIDFIDMVLESNRDLVLRRLTEALARDRTRHQVSEVTSLGLVQLTRKRLGTGLIEAFSTSCPHCSGRGILLHADPVDSAPTTGRKADSGGRRNRRSKKNRAEEPSEKEAVAKVPTHAPGEHPMFKAMAASSSSEAEHGDGEVEESGEELTAAVDDQTAVQVALDLGETEESEETDGSDETDETDETDDFDDDSDDSDEDDDTDETNDTDVDADEDEDTDEDVDGDEDTEDDDELDDDLDEDDLDDDDDLDEDDDDLDDELDDDDSDSDDEDGESELTEPAAGRPAALEVTTIAERPRRRRAAGAGGPPIHLG
ncbi:Rne/Rng family ribonuclease [Mycobacterium pseudoshottsii]|uniref:Rne/Rng family ribonuclease n=1 Tax=Mycobacterium pseudoshottsii TaxID=265949 RepID=UPI000A3212D5|nr:Rne/Rng family ribonuclease [Mycobacterium pseudoshottsii]MBC9864690.1 Ribonuclease E [Mycobacterium pseudoshottsii]BBA89241.1 ribonuclease E [Mycobacterium pseudoshottsii JCM 15466]